MDQPASTAIQQLQAFGLSTYAARMYVALLQNGVSTARDVSETAEVPRTRVYDAGDELAENDMVEVEDHSPKHFTPEPARDAIRTLRREYRYREATLTAVLTMLENDGNGDGSDVRTVTGWEAVVQCLVDAVRSASEEVILVTDGTPLSGDLVDALSKTPDEVQVRIVGDAVDSDSVGGPAVDSDVNDTGDSGNPGNAAGDGGSDGSVAGGGVIAPHVSEAETVTRIPEMADIPDGQRLLVDGTQAVVTISVANGRASNPTIAVWGSGDRNLLVKMLKDALTEWFDDDAVSTGQSS